MRFAKMRLFTSLILAPLAAAASRVPYQEYILAPASRDLVPQSVYEVNGTVVNPKALTQSSGGTTTFAGVSSVTYDFGKNVAGLVSLGVDSVSSSSAFMGVTFTESSLWISSEACDGTADAGLDSPLWFPVGHGPGIYTAAEKHLRGAFRYLTLVSNTTAAVSLNSLHITFTAAPTQNLRDYSGWFHSDDDLINSIWYAGAYTNQLCTINPAHGDALVHLGSISSAETITLPQTDSWWNNFTITNGSSTITDGAKRDRLVWPGDMSIALESIAVSTGDLYSIRMGLESLYALQQPNGRMPYAGKPFSNMDIVSYTYHLHSLIGTSYLYRFSGDKSWLSHYWGQYVKALQWALSSVDSTGLANVTASADWLRFGMGGHVSSYPWSVSDHLLIHNRTSRPMRSSTLCFKTPSDYRESLMTPLRLRNGLALLPASNLPPTACCGTTRLGCTGTTKPRSFTRKTETPGPSRPT